MSDRTKKILFAIVFVILSIAIGIGLYLFFFRPLVSPPPTGTEGPGTIGTLPQTPPGGPATGTGSVPPGTLPPGTTSPNQPGGTQTPGTSESRTRLLRDGITQAVTPTPDGNGTRFYNPEDGRFYRVNADGTVTAIGDKQFFNVETVNWAGRSDKAILEFPDGANVFYDFAAKRQVTMPKHWEDFSFSPDDEQIVAKAIGLDPSNRFLFVANEDGNEARAIQSLGANGDKVMPGWSPNNQVVAFAMTGRPQAEGAQEVYLVGENQENFKSLIVPGQGFLPNWSPNGSNLLYSVYHSRSQMKPSLWISGASGDNIGENRRSINLNTWADKCAWKNESELYCGVPQSLDAGAGLNRAGFSSVPDDLYHVDLRTGVATKISTPDQLYPVTKPILSDDGRRFIFTDSVTGRLYQYDLIPS